MNWLGTIALLLSHAGALRPFLRRIGAAKIPDVADFAVLSVVLYYDTGVMLELLGFSYPDEFFTPFFESPAGPRWGALALLAVAPWLFRWGAALIRGRTEPEPAEPTMGLAANRRHAFYAVSSLLSVGLAVLGYAKLTEHGPIWIARQEVGGEWGPMVVLLYLPLHFLAFYVRLRDSRSLPGLVYCLFLVASMSLATLAVGQRTNVLMPLLVLALFRFRPTLPRMLVAAGVLVAVATLSLPAFKGQRAQPDETMGEMMLSTVFTDVSRAQVLTEALTLSELRGSTVLPFPFAGYWYSAWFFVPRAMAPFKMYPTAAYFTTAIVGGDPDALDWGFGMGAIEEAAINGGLLALPFMLLIYGIGLGLLGRWSAAVPSIVVPTRLAALWLCGYHLPALLLLFATMGAICWVGHRFCDIGEPSPGATAAGAEPNVTRLRNPGLPL